MKKIFIFCLVSFASLLFITGCGSKSSSSSGGGGGTPASKILTLVSCVPSGNGISITAGTALPVHIVFSQPMTASDVNANLVFSGGGAQGGALQGVAQSGAFAIDASIPGKDINYATSYQIIISKNLISTNKYTLNNNIIINFQTKPKPGNPKLTFNSSIPANHATGVKSDAKITLTFNESMSTNNVHPSDVTISPNASIFSLASASGNNLIYNLNAAQDTNYTITIKGSGNGIMSSSGDYMIGDSSFSFTTSGSNPGPVPNPGSTTNVWNYDCNTTYPGTVPSTVKTTTNGLQGTGIDRNLFNVDVSTLSKQPGDGAYNFTWGTDEFEGYFERNDVLKESNSITLTAIAKTYPYLNPTGFKIATNYMSSRITTKDKEDFCPTTGSTLRIAATVILSKKGDGLGVWPAIWMRPTDLAYGTWPASGEIDIAEFRGNTPNIVLGTAHFGNDFFNHVYRQGSFSGTNFFDGAPHTFGIYWNTNEIQWFVNDKNSTNKNDDHIYYTLKKTGLIVDKYVIDNTNPFEHSTTFIEPMPGSGFTKNTNVQQCTWPFDKRFYLVFNVACGGSFFRPSSAANDPYYTAPWHYSGKDCASSTTNISSSLPGVMTIKKISVSKK